MCKYHNISHGLIPRQATKRLQLKVYQSLQHGYDKHASPLTSLYSCHQYFPFDPVTLFISILSCYAEGISLCRMGRMTKIVNSDFSDLA